jgi:small GTP-binding protein
MDTPLTIRPFHSTIPMSEGGSKAVLIGDSAVGKTSIYRRLDTNTFDPQHIQTVGGSYIRLPLELADGTRTELGLWDTAGQEKYRGIVPLYFQNASIILLVFDVTDRTTFQNIDRWVELTRERADLNVHLILAGNKVDLAWQRAVTYDEAQDKAAAFNAAYIELSALTGDGFELLHGELVKICGHMTQKVEITQSEKNEEQPAKAPVGLTPANKRSGCC